MNEYLADPDFASIAPSERLRRQALGFVDVGVRGGVHPVVDTIAATTSVVAFEPDYAECVRLQAACQASPRWKEVAVEPLGLSDRTGEALLHLTSAETNASLRPVNRPFVDRYRMVKFQPTGAIPIRITTLDDVLKRYPNHGEMLKLDTQSTEYEILQGSRKTLTNNTVALIVEVWYSPPYEGQMLFSEVEIFLRSLGFSFYGASVHARSRKLMNMFRETIRERPLWGDAIFFKDPLAGGPSDIRIGARGLHVLFVAAMLLGYYDFALELAMETWAEGEERVRLERFVRRRANLPRWRSEFSALGLALRSLFSPARANVVLGKFVDGKRDGANYEYV